MDLTIYDLVILILVAALLVAFVLIYLRSRVNCIKSGGNDTTKMIARGTFGDVYKIRYNGHACALKRTKINKDQYKGKIPIEVITPRLNRGKLSKYYPKIYEIRKLPCKKSRGDLSWIKDDHLRESAIADDKLPYCLELITDLYHKTLHDYMKKPGPLLERYKITRQLIDSVYQLRQSKIVARDIHFNNIMLDHSNNIKHIDYDNYLTTDMFKLFDDPETYKLDYDVNDDLFSVIRTLLHGVNVKLPSDFDTTELIKAIKSSGDYQNVLKYMKIITKRSSAYENTTKEWPSMYVSVIWDIVNREASAKFSGQNINELYDFISIVDFRFILDHYHDMPAIIKHLDLQITKLNKLTK